MNGAFRVTRGHVLAVMAGFLTRPCCVVQAALSMVGVGGAGLAGAVAPYRPALLLASGLLLATAIWLTCRREGGLFSKAFAAGAAILAFALSATFLEIL